jgi:hypothetical protein
LSRSETLHVLGEVIMRATRAVFARSGTHIVMSSPVVRKNQDGSFSNRCNIVTFPRISRRGSFSLRTIVDCKRFSPYRILATYK